MIRSSMRVLVLVALISIGQSVSAQGVWEHVAQPLISSGAVNAPALAISASGTPYVAFGDATQGYRATVMSYDGTNWNIVGQPGFGLSTPGPFALALDSNGLPYVAGRDNNKLTVMRFNGSAWVTVGTPRFSEGDMLSYASLRLDANNRPYVAYIDEGYNGRLSVYHFNGSAWVGTHELSSLEAYSPNMALNSNGRPYVVYTDADASFGPTVQHFNGTSWVRIGDAGFTESGAYPVIAVDALNTPHVAMFGVEGGIGASVYKFTGSEWTPVGERAFSDGMIGFISLAFDGLNTPYVVYEDVTRAGAATVKKYTGGNWVTVGAPGFTIGATSYGIGIDFDHENTPYVAYRDGANGNRLSVMSFNASTPPVISESIRVASPSNSQTPAYVFTSSQPGSIAYGGACRSNTTTAVTGLNIITFQPLTPATYTNCTITVTNGASQVSNTLTVSPFTITSRSGRSSQSTRVGVYAQNNPGSALNASTTPGTNCTIGPIARTLTLGVEGEDVRSLQRFLNCRGFTVSQSGVGAPGFETTYFGNLTQAAVTRFQEAYASQILAPLNLARGTGIFGERSRVHAQNLQMQR